MQKEVWLALFLLILPIVFAECKEPVDGMKISESILLCSDTFDVPSGISITASDIVLDCGTAVLRGTAGQSEIGLRLENVNNVTVKNCNILTFDQGIYLKNLTHSLIQNNGFLKNRIGIRLLDSYENIIRDNNDKSHEFAVSAINSKYNVVMLGNKNVERGFCDVNSCNEFRDMNPCESGDSYCSSRCAPETDSDCGKPAALVETPASKENAAEQIEKEVKQQFNESAPAKSEKKTAPVWLFIYGFAAIIAIVALIAFVKKKR